jgi:beta-N-acetylhexosaminidase
LIGRWLSALARAALICALTSLFLPQSACAQDSPVDQLMAMMTPEEKVGQIFMVDFVGIETSPESRIADLVVQYKVGSVFISESNGNILNDGEEPTAGQVARLTNALQALAHGASAGELNGAEAFVPLFIAVQQEGNGYPYSDLRKGFTPVLSNMSLGASWSEDNARAMGAIVGRELAAVGINMLLGPVADVLQTPRSGERGDLGVRVFGGSPYWVGRLARAYIAGVHEGSDRRVATIAKHFPGHGGSGRDSESEVGTITMTLEELREQDLVPFTAITRYDASEPEATTDGLLVGHIRSQAFQENMQFFSDPLTLDERGLAAAMELPEFSSWQSSGLLVADFLGSEAIKEHLNARRAGLPHFRIAREALMAGNDILPLVEFSLSGDWEADAYPRIVETIKYFQERYRFDPGFQTIVDESVRKILQAKLELYADWSPTEVSVDVEAAAASIGGGWDQVRDAAAAAVTLLYPSREELDNYLPAPPSLDDDILILQCFEDCYPEPVISGQALPDALLRIYGPEGTGQVAPERVRTLGFGQVGDWMNGALPKPDADTVNSIVQEAEWVIIALSDYNPDEFPAARVVKDLLRQREYYFGNKIVVAIAFEGPYHLDESEVAKLNAYFAVYGRVLPSLEAALRPLLEAGFVAAGKSPVDVQAVGYEVASILEPNPDQVISLEKISPPGDDPLYVGGESVVVSTGVILDRNGHAVPDGTGVEFRGDYVGSDIFVEPQVVTDTVGGVAGASFWLGSAAPAGLLRVSAQSGEATSDSVLVRVVVPVTPFPTYTPTATATPSPTPTRTPVPATPTRIVATPTPTAPPPTNPPTRPVDWYDFVLAAVGTTMGTMFGTQTRSGRRKGWEREVQLILYGVALGLVGYILYGLGLLNPTSILGWEGLEVRMFLLALSLVLGFLPSAAVWLRNSP